MDFVQKVRTLCRVNEMVVTDGYRMMPPLFAGSGMKGCEVRLDEAAIAPSAKSMDSLYFCCKGWLGSCGEVVEEVE